MSRDLTFTKGLYQQSQGHRQIVFLELVADAIVRLEQAPDLEAACAELRESRNEYWGRKPWPSATDPARFREHVQALARAFVSGPGPNNYPGRKLTFDNEPEPAKVDPWPSDIRRQLDHEYAKYETRR